MTPIASALMLPEGGLTEDPMWDSWWTLGEKYADQFPLEPGPEGLSVEASVQHWLHERLVQGRTPVEWIRHARDGYAVDAATSGLPAGKDLETETLRLYQILGVELPPLADLSLRTAAVDPALRTHFAGFLSLVVDAYAEQQVRAENILDRMYAGIDVDSVLVQPDERDAMSELQMRLTAAFLALRAATDGFETVDAAEDEPPLFTDPLNLIYLGGTGSTHYAPSPTPFVDPVLVVDLGGDDLYTTSAGGACPDATNLLHRCNLLALSAVFDAAGNDEYSYSGVPAAVQGAGSSGGVGMLIDLTGNDRYVAHFERAGTGPFFQYLDGGAQGFAQAGSAVILDALGNDHYEITVRAPFGRSIWGFGQGFGSLGSLGLAMDLSGADTWVGLGLGGTSGNGFQGLYPQGSGFYGGVGIILDLGLGADTYHAYLEAQTTDYYAQGFGAFGGLGIQFDDGGNDSYYAVEKANAPWINPLLNCAFGTASLGGVGVFIDLWGDDTYYGDTISTRQATTMNEGFGGIGAAYGVHVDLSGDDSRTMLATGQPGSFATGRGHALQGGNIIGNYLDSGGLDQYLGGPGSNNAVWSGGADQDIIPGWPLP